MEVRRRRRRRGTDGAARGLLVGADRQDALHRAVGRIPHLQRAAARGIEPLGAVPLTQPDDALRGAQVVQRVIGQQPDDQLGDVLTEGLRAGAAPDRGAHEERDLLRRVVGRVGVPAPSGARPGLDQLPVAEDLHQNVGDPGVDPLADVHPRHAVEHPVQIHVAVRRDPRRQPAGQLERRGRQRQQRRRLDRLEQRQRLRAVQAAVRPGARDRGAPRHRAGLHVDHTAERAAPPERVPDIGHHPLDPRLVAGLLRPRGVDQAAVMLGHLRVRPVQSGVIQVSLDHAGLQVVDDQPVGRRPEVLPGGQVRGHPRGLVHREHRPHEHVPGTGQHDHERPYPADPVGQRVQPPAQIAVVDLRLTRRYRRPKHGHRRPVAVREDLGHIAAQAAVTDPSPRARPAAAGAPWPACSSPASRR